MKEYKVFSLEPYSHTQCSKLRDLLNDGWLILRVDSAHQQSFSKIVYILERLK